MSERSCPECGWSGAHLSTCSLIPAASPSPEALDLRHAGHARLLNQEDDPSTTDGAYAADEPVVEG